MLGFWSERCPPDQVRPRDKQCLREGHRLDAVRLGCGSKCTPRSVEVSCQLTVKWPLITALQDPANATPKGNRCGARQAASLPLVADGRATTRQLKIKLLPDCRLMRALFCLLFPRFLFRCSRAELIFCNCQNWSVAGATGRLGRPARTVSGSVAAATRRADSLELFPGT